MHLTSVRCGLRAVPYASECALRHCVVGCSGLNDVAHDVRAATYTLMDQSDAFSDRRSPHALPSLPTLPTLPSLPTLFPIDVPRPTTSQAERTVAGRVRVRVCACESACGRVCVFACEQRALCRASLRCMFHCLARWRGHSVVRHGTVCIHAVLPTGADLSGQSAIRFHRCRSRPWH